jgi:hypothetical protein
MMTRFGFVLGLALLLSAAGGGVAQACITQGAAVAGLGSSADAPLHPADSSVWKITNLGAGATYTVSIEGREIASGTTTAAGPATGSFTMGNYGPEPQALTLSAVVSHEDIEGGETPPLLSTVYYAPTPTAEPPQQAPATATPTPAAPEKTRSASHRAPVKRADRHTVTPRPVHRRTPRGAPATRQPAQPRTIRPATTAAPVIAAVAPAATAAPAHRSANVRRERTTARALPTQAPPVFAHAVSAVARRAVAEPRSASPPSDRRGTEALIALAVLALAGLGGAGAWALRRRRVQPPQQPGDTVEAELQELIAEERARDDVAPRAGV